MTKISLKYRMYGLVPYNLSKIQQGIQFGHAVVEYINKFLNVNSDVNSLLKWMKEDKTFIILNGGTTNSSRELGTGIAKGTLNQYLDELQEHGINVSYFHEPDLGDQLTAFVFLVDERVWDKEKYPDCKVILRNEDVVEEFKKEKLSVNDYENMIEFLTDFEEQIMLESYKNWVEYLGGPTNVWLREFLSKLSLA